MDVDDDTTPDDIQRLVYNIEDVLHEARVNGELSSNFNDSESGVNGISID